MTCFVPANVAWCMDRQGIAYCPPINRRGRVVIQGPCPRCGQHKHVELFASTRNEALRLILRGRAFCVVCVGAARVKVRWDPFISRRPAP